jgi:predicted heme/steroid binding protein
LSISQLSAMRVFTREELKKYNGRDGVSYVAYSGKVYDVSSSFQWQKGVHQVIHRAGRDLTDALKQAPHDVDMLDKFPIVGELVE